MSQMLLLFSLTNIRQNLSRNPLLQRQLPCTKSAIEKLCYVTWKNCNIENVITFFINTRTHNATLSNLIFMSTATETRISCFYFCTRGICFRVARGFYVLTFLCADYIFLCVRGFYIFIFARMSSFSKGSTPHGILRRCFHPSHWRSCCYILLAEHGWRRRSYLWWAGECRSWLNFSLQ